MNLPRLPFRHTGTVAKKCNRFILSLPKDIFLEQKAGAEEGRTAGRCGSDRSTHHGRDVVAAFAALPSRVLSTRGEEEWEKFF